MENTMRLEQGYYIDDYRVDLLHQTEDQSQLRFFISYHRETIYIVNNADEVVTSIHSVADTGVAYLYLTANDKRKELARPWRP
jgi:hypothetical protein